jgi:hypothetical protein
MFTKRRLKSLLNLQQIDNILGDCEMGISTVEGRRIITAFKSLQSKNATLREKLGKASIKLQDKRG